MFLLTIFALLVLTFNNNNNNNNNSVIVLGAAVGNDQTVTELVRLLQDGSNYLMKMVGNADPRFFSEINNVASSTKSTISSLDDVNMTSFSLSSIENDLDDLFSSFLSSIDPNSVNAASVRIIETSGTSTEFLETSSSDCIPGFYKPKAMKTNAKIFGPQLAITLRAGECRVVRNITNSLRKIECDSPSIAYAVLPGGVSAARGETAELFAGETCGLSVNDRDIVYPSDNSDILIRYDDPLIVGLSEFA
mgnify:CR=1 FL=1|jgi:hypothetical protein